MSEPLIIRVSPDETDGGLIATVDQMPGCGTQGETVVEILDNLSDAIAAWAAIQTNCDNCGHPLSDHAASECWADADCRCSGPLLWQITTRAAGQPAVDEHTCDATARAEKAEAAVARVRALHRPVEPLADTCAGCGWVTPCLTIRALDGERP